MRQIQKIISKRDIIFLQFPFNSLNTRLREQTLWRNVYVFISSQTPEHIPHKIGIQGTYVWQRLQGITLTILKGHKNRVLLNMLKTQLDKLLSTHLARLSQTTAANPGSKALKKGPDGPDSAIQDKHTQKPLSLNLHSQNWALQKEKPPQADWFPPMLRKGWQWVPCTGGGTQNLMLLFHGLGDTPGLAPALDRTSSLKGRSIWLAIL